MPNYLQGDIFQEAMNRPYDLAVVFGHVGFNQMSLAWQQFRERVPAWADIADPFTHLAAELHPLGPRQWVWFVPEERNHGMTQQTLTTLFLEILEWVAANGIRTLITNGIADVDHAVVTADNRASDDRRTHFLINLLTPYERNGLKLTFISLNDVFLRNCP